MSRPSRTPMSQSSHPLADSIEWIVLVIARHWLLVLIGYGATVALLPVVAPLLMVAGWSAAAAPIYFVYSFICHQHTDRSIHLLGQQMAYCARDMAIFSGAVLAATIYAVLLRIRNVHLVGSWVLAVAVIPIAVDGFTQLAGLRDSTTTLRIATGLWFSIGIGWYMLPRLAAAFAVLAYDIEQRFASEAGDRAGGEYWMEIHGK